MKLIFKEGKFIERKDKEEINFEPCGTDVEAFFCESFERVTSIFDCYELGMIEDKNIYYLYPTIKDCIPGVEIHEELNRILLGDDSNVINKDNTTIFSPGQFNTIFWDVMNSIIIVYGKENLKKLLLEIEKAKIPGYIHFNTDEEKMELVECLASPIYRKVKSL